MEKRIDICAAIREKLSDFVAELLGQQKEWSETDFRNMLQKRLEVDNSLWPKGWYDPPPGGISALFSVPGDYRRLQFDTLRKEEFWPTSGKVLQEGSAGMLYASPVDRASGIIGDWGMTIYLGDDPVVQAHFRNCLEGMEDMLEQISTGMEFREIHDTAQNIFKKRHLTNARTLTLTDRTGTNLGHTIPWSYEEPTNEETALIRGEDFDSLKNIISHKRINVNRQEIFVIPETIVFTFEARLEDSENLDLPNVFFHYTVTFKEGRKKILANFNNVFEAVGMDYLKSAY